MDFWAISDYIVLDLETTGLDANSCEIIEAAALRIRDNKIVAEYQQLCSPRNGVPDSIERLTGISCEMLDDMPMFCDIAQDFRAFIGKDIILGHNVSFDMGFLSANCKNNPELNIDNKRIDTLSICRKFYKEWPDHKLTTMCAELNAPDNGAHRALSDCYSTWFCFEQMKREIANPMAKPCNPAPAANTSRSFDFPNSRIKISDIKPETDLFDCNHPFYLKSCVFTGELKLFERAEAMQLVVNAGGIIRSSISSKTDFLIVGSTEDNYILHGRKSSKELEAQKLIESGKSIKILTESQFYDIIGSSENLLVEVF